MSKNIFSYNICIIKAAPTKIFPLRGLFEAVTRAADGEKEEEKGGGEGKGGKGKGSGGEVVGLEGRGGG